MTTGSMTERTSVEGNPSMIWGVLLAAIVAISSSALLVRWADASAVALAFWRTLGGALVLVAVDRASWASTAVAEEENGPDTVQATPTTNDWRLIVIAGVALGVHFAAWLASLELTSVAASVTLVATAPLMIAIYEAVRGKPPSGRTWMALLVAIVGTVIIAAGDLSGETVGATELSGLASTLGISNAILGDALALIGAAAMAVYLVAGSTVRRRLTTSAYAWRAYAVAAGALALWAAIAGVGLTGFNRTTWLAIGAMILGPQLLGHTGLNHLLRYLGSITVSLALLIEPLTASLLVWLVFSEAPSAGAYVGGPLVILAVAMHLLADRT